MREISLTNSDKVAIVDNGDYEEVSKHRWWLRYDEYVLSSSRINGKHQYLHRFILHPPSGTGIDHVNHNPLDNRRENLRFATQSQNMANGLRHQDGTSRFKGVCWNKEMKSWRAKIVYRGIHIHLGNFTSETSAAIAYDLAALKYFREFSKLNFPERITIE